MPLYPLFGESKRNPLKNREGGGALALGGRRLMMQCNNRPKVGSSSRWYVIAERVGGGARGGTPSNRLGWRIERQKKKKTKYNTALHGHQSMNFYTTTNQKQAAATERTTEGRCDEREVRGSAISLFFGGGKSN
jgi:hypothetical protein